jgi:hypothetical protein
VVAVTNTHIKNEACPTSLELEKVGIISISVPKSCIEMFEKNWRKLRVSLCRLNLQANLVGSRNFKQNKTIEGHEKGVEVLRSTADFGRLAFAPRMEDKRCNCLKLSCMSYLAARRALVEAVVSR